MMRNTITTLLSVATLLGVSAVPGRATLAGTSVDGSLVFSGDPSNYFDPGNGFVPATGYLNVSGTTVTVSDSAVEFGFDDGSSLISADFSGSQLIINDAIEISGPTNSFELVFTDPTFAGQYLIPISDGFPLASRSLVGDVVTVDYAGGNLTAGQTLRASFNIAPIPEPSPAASICLSGLAGLAIFFLRRRWLTNLL